VVVDLDGNTLTFLKDPGRSGTWTIIPKARRNGQSPNESRAAGDNQAGERPQTDTRRESHIPLNVRGAWQLRLSAGVPPARCLIRMVPRGGC